MQHNIKSYIKMKIKNISILALVLMLSLSYTSCSKMAMDSGNGHIMSETRKLIPFTEIINTGEFHVFVVKDTVSEAVVEGDANLIPYIRTIVEGNTLIIDSRENISPSGPITIYLKTPQINSIKLSGSGSIETDSLTTHEFVAKLSGSGIITANVKAHIVEAEISGSGNMNLMTETDIAKVNISGSGYVTIWGSATEGEFEISGSGDIKSYAFSQTRLNAIISGSGNMYVSVAEYLKALISGSGSIFYRGDAEVDKTITGSGSVIHQ